MTSTPSCLVRKAKQKRITHCWYGNASVLVALPYYKNNGTIVINRPTPATHTRRRRKTAEAARTTTARTTTMKFPLASPTKKKMTTTKTAAPNNCGKGNSTTGGGYVPKGWEHVKSCQVYILPTKTATSKWNDDIKKPPKNSTTKHYWLGEYHAQSPSEIWCVAVVLLCRIIRVHCCLCQLVLICLPLLEFCPS